MAASVLAWARLLWLEQTVAEIFPFFLYFLISHLLFLSSFLFYFNLSENTQNRDQMISFM